MKNRVLKEWVIYLITGILYGLAITKAGSYAEIDALIVGATSLMMLIAGYWIQKHDNEKELKKSYERGVKDAIHVLNPLQHNCRQSYYKLNEEE